ncbi:hypothetical protein L6452_43276 [Arctium lappa]|uniref:Uncharacterized protein n=1 Tax=Arctium lappa TaxID=4217 RepID=A0ACB8XL57_ARCLA|nr:hypothetical protein L6452_43276 [Arctium lappa]
MAPSAVEPEASVQRKMVVLPSSEPEPVCFADIATPISLDWNSPTVGKKVGATPISQDWNSPTLGKKVDIASTKKSDAAHSDKVMDESCKENDVTFCAGRIDKGKQVLADMAEEVIREVAHESNNDHSSYKGADNATCMTSFAYFSAPSYDLGISP